MLLSILKDQNLITSVRAVTTESSAEVLPAMRAVAAKLSEEFDAKLKSEWHVRRVRHITNRAVKYCEALFKASVEKIRSLLKTFRLSAIFMLHFERPGYPWARGTTSMCRALTFRTGGTRHLND